MQSVATHFHRLPCGPLLLPGVLADLATDGLLEAEDILKNLVEAQEQSRWLLDISSKAQQQYAGVVAALQQALERAPVWFRNDVALRLLAHPDPALVSWAAGELAAAASGIEKGR